MTRSAKNARWIHTLFSGVLASCLVASTQAAEVYKVVDEDGRVTYTDSPPQGKKAEKLELRQSNSLPPIVTERPARDEPEAELPPDYDLQITYPPHDFHVNPGIRDLNIQVAVEPSLEADHQLQITDNGEVINGTTMENIVVRGTHVIQARVVDEQGRTLSEAEPIEIHVHRPARRN